MDAPKNQFYIINNFFSISIIEVMIAAHFRLKPEYPGGL